MRVRIDDASRFAKMYKVENGMELDARTDEEGNLIVKTPIGQEVVIDSVEIDCGVGFTITQGDAR